jgi:hypothetical protein
VPAYKLGFDGGFEDPLRPSPLDSQIEASENVRADRVRDIAGTREWTKLERVFVTAATTSLVQVEIMRQASLRMDNKIAGTAWIDAVDVRPTL